MLHTPLHRLLGESPGPLTEQMIDDAVTQGIEENDELDWKAALPPQKGFRDSDIVKDIAAFANAGGGMIVFGIDETSKAASGRVDAGELTENYERTIRQVCMGAITPPVFGVQVIAIPTTTVTRAVALVIPDSADVPHLVYRNDYFGAPLRVNADTHWMKERQVETAYRSRFDSARRGEEALQQIYDDMAAAGAGNHAVFVATARPRIRRPKVEPVEDVTSIVSRASLVAQWWLSGRAATYHPLEDLDIYRTRPTLAGTHLAPKDPDDYRAAHAAVYDNGSVGLSWRVGGHEHLKSGRRYEPHQVDTLAIEGFAAALVALVHSVAATNPYADYEVTVGVEPGDQAAHLPEFHEINAAPPHGVHQPFSGRFRPVHATINPRVNDTEFIQAAIDLATACLNQVGLKKPVFLDHLLPARPREWTW